MLYTFNIPVLETPRTATFADDTYILAIRKTQIRAKRTPRRRIKLNETKSVHNFTNRKIDQTVIALNNISNTTSYC